MSDQTKRIIFGIIFGLVSVGIAVALYIVFFRPAQAPTPVEPEVIDETELTEGGLPTAGEGVPTTLTPGTTDAGLVVSDTADGGLTATTSLTTGSVGAATLSPDGSSVNYYDASTGKFYTINEDGTVTVLSDATFPNASAVVWADSGDKAVIEFPDGSNVIYNFTTETQITLPSHWEDFEFSPDSDEIIAKSLGIDPNNRWLVITSDDGSQTEVVAALGENEDKVQVSWSPNDQVVAFSQTGETQSGFGREMVIPIGKNDENYNGLVVEGVNFEAIWSPNGDKIVYSVAGSINNYKPLLWIVDGDTKDLGENRRSLGIETWVDKCIFTSNTKMICAVPQNLPNNAGIQPGLVTDEVDYIYEINLSSGASALLAIPEEEMTIANLTLSADGSSLYFTNAETGVLNMIKL